MSVVEANKPASQMTHDERKAVLFDRLGGAEAMDAVVDSFYRRVLMDDRISHFFDNIEMEEQHRKQKAFLTMVTGGPNNYSGKDMREAHKHMNINEMHFDAVAENLVDTLKEFNVSQSDINDVVAIAVSVKDEVLNR